ncbi:MAG: hypothetical protein GXO08_00795 [Aquificae bacterium]|nr:hypothetical protein [Aquificota bacterium]
MRKEGAVVAYSNEKNLLVILKTCEGAEKLLSPEGERAFKNFVSALVGRIEDPLEVLDRYTEVKRLFKELKEELGITKAGIFVYDIEKSYPLSTEEGLDRLVNLIESETIWEKPVLAYSRCLEDTPILRIYDLDRNEVFEPSTV